MRLLRERTSKTRMLVTILAGISLVTATIPSRERIRYLNAGGQAVIAYANGDSVRLRSGPGYDSISLTIFPKARRLMCSMDRSRLTTAHPGTAFRSTANRAISCPIGWRPAVACFNPSGSARALDTVNVRTGPGTAEMARRSPAATKFRSPGQLERLALGQRRWCRWLGLRRVSHPELRRSRFGHIGSHHEWRRHDVHERQRQSPHRARA